MNENPYSMADVTQRSIEKCNRRCLTCGCFSRPEGKPCQTEFCEENPQNPDHIRTDPDKISPATPFQDRVDPWLQKCFGREITYDGIERNHRFLEEALELVQSRGCTKSEAHQLVDYVFGRPEGEVQQEIGGVMVTLAALCIAAGENMHEAGELELARIWMKVDQIRAKQEAKPKHSPLPGPSPHEPIQPARKPLFNDGGLS